MTLTSISTACCINSDRIAMILEANNYDSRANNIDETIKNTIASAKKKGKYYDITNDRDGLKTIVVYTDGLVCGFSLTQSKLIEKIMSNIYKPVRNTKTGTTKNNQ